MAETQPNDSAAWMVQKGLSDPAARSQQHVARRPGCYICEDPEFELMGLPLCRPCPVCTLLRNQPTRADGGSRLVPYGHVPADDTACSDCDQDAQEWHEAAAFGDPAEIRHAMLYAGRVHLILAGVFTQDEVPIYPRDWPMPTRVETGPVEDDIPPYTGPISPRTAHLDGYPRQDGQF